MPLSGDTEMGGWRIGMPHTEETRARLRKPKLGKTWQQRFDQYLKPDPATGCVLWVGGKDSKGYGQFYLGTVNAIVTRAGAHRVAYE